MRTHPSPTLLLALLLPVGLGAQQGGMLDMSEFPRPIEAVDNVWIEQLTMLEVRDYLAEGRTTALILTGGIEENGPYLTTGKHNHVLEVMGESIARALGNTLVAPIVTLEPGDPSRDQPGTVLVSRPVWEAYLSDMARSLKSQGFTEIFLLGDNGGNARSLEAVARDLSRAWRGEGVLIAHIPEYYNYDDVVAFQRDVLGVDEDPRLEGLHDDYYITSIIMNDNPEYVRLEQRAAAGKASINGISILPAEKTLEHGRRIIQFRTDATVAGIQRVRAESGLE
jgi:creatinine amidohydrolase